jgi:hypothetical protein
MFDSLSETEDFLIKLLLIFKQSFCNKQVYWLIIYIQTKAVFWTPHKPKTMNLDLNTEIKTLHWSKLKHLVSKVAAEWFAVPLPIPKIQGLDHDPNTL